MRVTGKLQTGVAGPGFVLRSGTYTGDIDERGVIWLTVPGTHRIPTEKAESRRVGVHASKFGYLEEPSSAPPADRRAQVKEQIRAAEKISAARTVKA